MSGKKLRIFLCSALASVMVVTDLGTAGASLKAAQSEPYQNEMHEAETKEEAAGITDTEGTEIPEGTETQSGEAVTETTGLPDQMEATDIPEATEEIPEGTEEFQEPIEDTEIPAGGTEEIEEPAENTEILTGETEDMEEPEEATEALEPEETETPEDTEMPGETELITDSYLYKEGALELPLNKATKFTFTQYAHEYIKITIPAGMGKGYIQISAAGSNGAASDDKLGSFRLQTPGGIALIDDVDIYRNETAYSMKIGVEPGIYYIDNYCRNKQSTVTYQCKFTSNQYWESEPNDTAVLADMINVNTAYYANTGTYTGDGEYDYYKFTVPKDGAVNISFNHPLYSNLSTSYYDLKLYDSKFGEIDSFSSKGSDTSINSTMMGLRAGTYYLKVDAWSTHDEYNFKVNYTASDDWEKENNDSANLSSVIALNKVYSGTLRHYSDLDYYRFTTTSAGVVSLEFMHNMYAEMNSSYYTVSVYDKSGTFLYSQFKSNGAQTSVKDTSIGLPAGTYLIKVGDGAYTSNDVYKFKVNYKKTSDWETESNDTINMADSISLSKTTYGAISSNSDTDFFKFGIKDNGYIGIDFGHKNLGYTDKAYKISLYDAKGNELYEFASKGVEKLKSLKQYGLGKGTYYLSVKGLYNWSNADYNLKVNYKKASNWETENNNDMSVADKISLDKTYNGTTVESDNDYYKFTLSAKTWVNISFSHESTGSTNSHWYVSLYDKNGNTLSYDAGRKYIQTLYVKGTQTYQSTGNIQLAKGSYYVRINAYSNYSEAPYKLTVNKVNIKAPSISGVKSSAYNKLQVSWKSVGGADQYYVYRSTSKNGTYKKIATVSAGKTSYTDSKVTTGKTYYYKIKSYGTTSKKTTSGYSKVKSGKAVPGSTTVTLKSGGSKKAKVSWKKVSGASGYEVYYSTSKNGSFKKASTIKKGSTVSYTKSGLKAKKTYYFKVRAYRTVKGKKIFGSYSSVKSLKVT